MDNIGRIKNNFRILDYDSGLEKLEELLSNYEGTELRMKVDKLRYSKDYLRKKSVFFHEKYKESGEELEKYDEFFSSRGIKIGEKYSANVKNKLLYAKKTNNLGLFDDYFNSIINELDELKRKTIESEKIVNEMSEKYSCPECRSEDIIYDGSRGDTVCEGCGLIIFEKELESNQRRAFTREEKKKRIHNEVVMNGKLGSLIKVNDIKKKSVRKKNMFNRIRKIHGLASIDRNLNMGYNYIDKISAKLKDVNHAVRRDAKNYLEKMHELGLIIGSSYEIASTACLYASSKKNNRPVNLNELEDATEFKKPDTKEEKIMGVPKEKISKYYEKVKNHISVENKRKSVKFYIAEFSGNLGIDYFIEKDCADFFERLNEKNNIYFKKRIIPVKTFVDNNRSAVAAGIVYIISNKKKGVEINNYDFYKKNGYDLPERIKNIEEEIREREKEKKKYGKKLSETPSYMRGTIEEYENKISKAEEEIMCLNESLKKDKSTVSQNVMSELSKVTTVTLRTYYKTIWKHVDAGDYYQDELRKFENKSVPDSSFSKISKKLLDGIIKTDSVKLKRMMDYYLKKLNRYSGFKKKELKNSFIPGFKKESLEDIKEYLKRIHDELN